ncbi:lipid droplet assembly factor 1-like [Dunckerocampus dactyliophorus]|uniref:lipid droplet assembly factor 1-like n=1 Tax=Dunckerocampus dactyliophorus TaxID=161453 RepID=UPI002407357A|nr:lipid droplet assembly factor 1-like [Dunckerocampus dactyliophorus]
MQQSRDEMQQQLWGGWTSVSNQVYNNPKVTLLMNTRVGQYLSGHPVLALAVLFFCAMAAVPVGLFLVFAVVTATMSAVGFVFFEGFLLFVAAITLLSVLSGLAFLSVMVSSIFAVFYITVSSLLNHYYTPQRTKQGVDDHQGNQDGTPTEDKMK